MIELRKPKVLWVGEASWLSSGFSTYSLEVLKRLHARGTLDLVEFACYGEHDDARRHLVPWEVFQNVPNFADPAQAGQYRSCKLNEFGMWKFEEALLKYRPDAVVAFRDWWMDEFMEHSPFRRFYHWCVMPTVDSMPQADSWVATYMNADAVFAYTDWGLQTLSEQTGGKIKGVVPTPPGADLETFRPVEDKRAVKEAIGMPSDALVVGTVMRNQIRKLYPDLIKAFGRFMREGPQDIAKRSYLYLHTSFPDLGWDIPRLVLEQGVASRTLFTYLCRACGASYPSFFNDARAFCRSCRQQTSFLPDVGNGVTRDVLARAYSLMDVYVQLATNEGFGMPMVEAGACGLSVMATDYSAMSDVVRKLGGVPIKCQLYREPGSMAYRAQPNEDDFVAGLTRLLTNEQERLRMGRDARQGVETHYTYEKTAETWANYLEKVPLHDPKETWDSPARIHTPNTEVPNGLTDSEYVRWCILNLTGRPELLDSYMALRMTRDLNWGLTRDGMGGLAYNDASVVGVGEARENNFKPCTREELGKQLLDICHRNNYWEKRRVEVAK